MNKATKKYPTTTIQCTGEAHSNPYIDNCGVCMPEWGAITVCAEPGCEHRPSEHAEDGCHGSKNQNNQIASERCGCTAKFTREGGKRTKLIAVEIRGGAIVHGQWTATRRTNRDADIIRTVRAIRTWDAFRDVRNELRGQFAEHIAECKKSDCRMDAVSMSARGSSVFGGNYDRSDFAAATTKK